MKSATTGAFWKHYGDLPAEARKQAKEAFRRFRQDPSHPGLHFKRVHSQRPVFSVRISRAYRSIGVLQGDEITWFWIGSHAEYDKLVKSMRGT